MDLANTTLTVRSVNSQPILSVVDDNSRTEVPLAFKNPQRATRTLDPRASQNSVIAALIQDGHLRVIGFQNGRPIVAATPPSRPTPPKAA